MNITYNFHGAVTHTFDHNPVECRDVYPCEAAVDVGDLYTGMFTWDGTAVTGYHLTFEDFNLFDIFDERGTEYFSSGELIFLDELPGGDGIAQMYPADNISFSPAQLSVIDNYWEPGYSNGMFAATVEGLHAVPEPAWVLVIGLLVLVGVRKCLTT